MSTKENLNNTIQSLESTLRQIENQINILERNKTRSQELVKNEYDELVISILFLQNEVRIDVLKEMKYYIEDALKCAKFTVPKEVYKNE